MAVATTDAKGVFCLQAQGQIKSVNSRVPTPQAVKTAADGVIEAELAREGVKRKGSAVLRVSFSIWPRLPQPVPRESNKADCRFLGVQLSLCDEVPPQPITTGVAFTAQLNPRGRDQHMGTNAKRF